MAGRALRFGIHPAKDESGKNPQLSEKQYALSGRPVKELISTWRDYLFMASRLNADIEEELIFKPKDLVAKHDEAVDLCGGKQIVERAEEILKDYPDIDAICRSIQENMNMGINNTQSLSPKPSKTFLSKAQSSDTAWIVPISISAESSGGSPT